MSECPFLNTQTSTSPANSKRPRDDDVKSPVSNDSHVRTHYGDYLAIKTLTSIQDGPSPSKPEGKGLMHHQELNFIIVHQVFELWFKLVLADMEQCRAYLKDIAQVDSDTYCRRFDLINGYMRRAEQVFSHVTNAFSIMETMNTNEFIEFRSYLVPASGFQSVQFRLLEQLLGLQRVSRRRVNNREVISYLTTEEQLKIDNDEDNFSLNDIVLTILARVNVPVSFRSIYLSTAERVLRENHVEDPPEGSPMAKHIEDSLKTTKAILDDPVKWSEGYNCANDEEEDRYKRAVLAALLITSYRLDPLYSMLATFLESCIALEEATLIWRDRHIRMVERMIGHRGGTGGTDSGVEYLNATRSYRIFHCLWLARSLLTRSSALPPLKEVFGSDPVTLFLSQ